ncbi:MAG: asparagine synthase (glutamine-hydrolyzing) [Alphaproteobacteria bacterium]|nr:asparagine synthase (glutamine-hydrolyzing) [Alphaproteobacteria bacterium]
MCGIAGILRHDGAPASADALQAMIDRLAHRGPDGEGTYLDGAVGLGHRRLAIIDPTPAGRQPMISADGRYALSFNGMIYNFRELRRELEALGHRFRSRTDTEVVLAACAAWGAAAIPRFNGMFAFALWDGAERTLTLARDRFGIKPLYYARCGRVFLFGSEVKAILAHPGAATRLDPAALLEYFTFQNLFAGGTLFAGVSLLPAGSTLTLRPGGTEGPAPERYWDYDFHEPATRRSEAAYLDELDHLFRQAVRRQLVADVPLGAYLSGGMDSGSVTALAARELPYMCSFTVGFDLSSASGIELGFDEREKAEHMSYRFRTEHYEMVLKSGDMERVLPALAWHIEEPRVGQSYPNYYAAKLAARFVKVVLSGAGGDELFGGYPWRYYRAVVNDDFEHYVDQYYDYWQRLIPGSAVAAVFGPIWPDVRHVSTRDIFRGVFQEHAATLTRPEDYINHSLYFEAKTFLHGLLVVEDKLSMAHGLETRVPFLDNDLVDFAMRVPVRLKLNNLGAVTRLNENQAGLKTRQYFAKTRDGKLILRKGMRRYIPESVTRRVKQGFSAPDASWFKGESIDHVRAVLYDDRARIYDFLDPTAVRALVDDHIEGRENRRLLIWSLLSFEHWCRTFLGAGAAHESQVPAAVQASVSATL